MAQSSLVELETSIKGMPGVLGCVILTTPDGAADEIQAFIRAGTDQEEIQKSILGEVDRRGLDGSLRHVFVFELEAESQFGDRESLLRAAEVAEQEARSRGPIATDIDSPVHVELSHPRESLPGPLKNRPSLSGVSISSSMWSSEAEVSLGEGDSQVVGQASGDKTPHGLEVLARATLEAAGRLVPEVEFGLVGASLVTLLGREAVLVLVAMDDGPETLGGALVRHGPVSEAAVRATLDAVNRRLTPR